MYCISCGREITSEARYCSACGQPTGFGPGQAAPKRLFRLSAEKKVAGVCAGFADYLNVDVTLVRILALIAICLTGFIPGLVAYILVWIIMPATPAPALGSQQPASATPVV